MTSKNKLNMLTCKKFGQTKKISYASKNNQSVDKLLTIYLNSKNEITNIFLSSNNFGTVEWEKDLGIQQCQKWENSELLKTNFYDEIKTYDNYAQRYIIPDVLDNLPNVSFALYLYNVISNKNHSKTIDLNTFSLNA